MNEIAEPRDRETTYPFAYVLLLLGINALNLADLAYTFLAFRAGYSEGNPVVNALFLNLGPVAGGLVKLAVTALFTLFAWRYRDRRPIWITTIVVFCVYWLLFFFHLYVTLQLI